MKRATTLKVLAGTLVLVMVASAFPLVDIALQAQEDRAKAAEARASTGAPTAGDLPFVPGAEGSVFAPANGTGADPATGQGGSSSRPGQLPVSQGQSGASGSALISQILGAAQLMGYDVEIPPLPLDQVAVETPLRAAILTWIATTGADVPPEELVRELARADALPLGLQRDLALLVLSASQATVLQHAALRELTDEQLAWVYSNPQVAEDLARGIETPETRAMATLAGLVDMELSIEASLLMLQAVDATRGALETVSAQQALLGLQAGDIDSQTASVLALLASAGTRVTDQEKVRFAAELIAATSGTPLPEPQPKVAFSDALARLMQATAQSADPDALAAVQARADLLPLDLQQAIAGLLAAQAVAVDAADPSRYTATGQTQALAGVLLAVADALPTFQKYNLYWRGAPEALRVSQWDPSLRAGWAAEHAALLLATHADPVDLVRAGGILHGATLVDPKVPERSFVEAYVAVANQAGVAVTPEVREKVAAAGDKLDPAVREAAARMMSGAAESSRLSKLAFAGVSTEDAMFLLSESTGLDALYTADSISEADLARLARATAVASKIDLVQLTAAATVGARATSEARAILEGQGAYSAQGHATPVPTGLRAFLARLLPFGTASAQGFLCQDLGPARDPDNQPKVVSNDCANDILLRLQLPLVANELIATTTRDPFGLGFGTISTPFFRIEGLSTGVHGNATICDAKSCWRSSLESNTEVLVITGPGSTTREPLTGNRTTYLIADEDDPSKHQESNPFQYGAPVVSLDLGGADTYTSPVAVTTPNATVPVSLHLDMGGADYYADPSTLYDARSPFVWWVGADRGHPTQGSAFYGGVAVLLDVSGDDRYDARTFSQGFGRYGTGLLADLGGADSYSARSYSQGAASDSLNLGVGILADLGGNDRYRAGSGQGYGLGGILVDAGGVDVYSNDHDATGAPMAHLEIVPGGNVTTLDERGDNKIWLDGPGTLSVGLAVDTEVTLSGRDSDGDGDSDFLEFVTGSNPDDPDENALEGPNSRLSKILVDSDRDLFPDFVERAFSTDPEDPSSYPVGFPRGPEFILPSEARLLGDSVVVGDALDGVGGPRGHDKIVDLRVPLQDAGTIDHGCTGPILFNSTTPLGLFPGENTISDANVVTGFLAPTSSTDPYAGRNACLTVSYATESPGKGNATLPSGATFGDRNKPSQFSFQLPAGILAIGDSIATAYADDYFVVIDLGGDDLFENSAGGALRVQTTPKPGTETNPVYNRTFLAPSLVVNVDPANFDGRVASPDRSYGKDVYANATRDYAQGSLFGVLIDTGGDDEYVAGNGSQGSIGGVLLDLRDNDTYRARDLSQGATIGASPSQPRAGFPDGGQTPSDDAIARRSVPALLLDFGAGDDSFRAGSHSQGFARGNAVTCDNTGGFLGVPCAARNTPISAGILLNADGNDVYSTAEQKGVHTQGVATQGGLGVLMDTGGNGDIYSAGSLISQGSTVSQGYNTGDKNAPEYAPRPGLGALVDTTGMDVYVHQDSRGSHSRNERSNNLTIARAATPVRGSSYQTYLDVGLHLDAERGDPVKALGAIGGVGGQNPSPTGQTGFALKMPSARLAIGDAEPTLYDREYAFVVDLGGDNTYAYNAAGFVHDMLARTNDPTPLNARDDATVGLFPSTFLLDAGSGSSKYTTGRSFAQGAGMFTTGVLVDLGGHDSFVATPQRLETYGNGWLRSAPIVDGTIGESTEWAAATKRQVNLTSVLDPRIASELTMWLGNDAQNLYLALSGKTLSVGANRTRDVMVIDLNPGHTMAEWDAVNGRTGIDQLVVTWASATRCSAEDRYYNQTAFTPDWIGRKQTHAIACRTLEDGTFFIELQKQLIPDNPVDAGDPYLPYFDGRGYEQPRLGFRIEFREAGTGYGSNDGVAEHYVYTFPGNTTNTDGNLSYRKSAGSTPALADEMADWAVTTLANLEEPGVPAVHTRAPAVSQGAAVSGVGILAMLGSGEAHATLVASDRAQAFASFGGFAAVLDAGGSDSYTGTTLVQGAAQNNGMALFLDLEGHENYRATGSAAGWSPATGTAAALFLDLSGDDEYRYLAPQYVLPTGGPADLPPGSALPPGNQRAWIQNSSIGIDHQTVHNVRGLAAGLAMQNLYGSVRTDLAVTLYEPGADDADAATGCTPRPLPVSSAVQKPIASGKVCLRATVNYQPRFVSGPNNGTVNVTSVDFFADRIRLATAVAGKPLAGTNASLFQMPVELAAVEDGVTRLKALASFTVRQPDGTVFAFHDDVKDDLPTNATKIVLVNNVPQPKLTLTPAFTGAANATFSPNAYGARRELLVNWTVPHDADEDRLDAYMGWKAPVWLANVPCEGTNGRLCNLLPFYLTGSGQSFSTTPGSKLPAETDARRVENHDGEVYAQISDPLKAEFLIAPKDSFHLALPDRAVIFPGTAAYTTSITVSLEGNGQRIVLASGNFTSEQSNEVGGTVSGLAGDSYKKTRNVVQGHMNNTLANLNGNPLYSTIQGQFNAQCPAGYESTGTHCGPLYGDYGRGTSLRPCREWKGGPLNPLVPILTGAGVCTSYTAYGLSIFAANESGPIVEDAIGDGTELLLKERMNASEVAQLAVNSTSFLNPVSPTELNWRHFFLDINSSLVDSSGYYKVPKGMSLRLDFGIKSDGLIREVGNLTADGQYGELLSKISPHLDVIPNSAPLRGLTPRDTVRGHLMGTNATVNGIVDKAANPIPLAVFTHSTGPAYAQPRLEVRTPTEPSTLAKITLERVAGETSAVLLGDTVVEGDIAGGVTRSGWGPNPALDNHTLINGNLSGDRFTQRNATFNGCCSVFGGDVEDGVYFVRVSGTDSIGTGEVVDTVLVDRTAPSSVITTPTYVGAGLIVGNKIPIRWSVLEAGSGLDATYVYYKVGEEGVTDPANWRLLQQEPYRGKRADELTKQGDDVYFALAIGVDRAGNVEAAPGAQSLAAAVQTALANKIGMGEGVGYSRMIVDQGVPAVNGTGVAGARLLNFEGSDLYFVKAGERLAFSVCARDPEQHGGLGTIKLNLDYVNATSGEVLSHAYTAQSRGSCGSGFTRYEYADWHLANRNKVDFPDGVWSASFDVYDLAGNRVQVAAGSVILDSQAPSLRIEPPVFPAGQTAVKPGDRVSVRVYAEDKFGVDTGRIAVDASKLTTEKNLTLRPVRSSGVLYQEATILVDRADVENREYNVTLTVYDNAGNARVGTVKIPVDFRKFEFVPGSLQVRSVTHNSAIVTWTTTEPSSSLVKFGTSPVDLRGRTPLNVTAVREHVVKVEGLQPKTTYVMRAVSASAGGFTNESDPLTIETGSALRITPVSPAPGASVSGAVPVRFTGGLLDSTDFVKYTLQVQPDASANWSFVTTLSEQGEDHALTFNSTRYLDGPAYRLRLIAEAGKDQTSVTFGPFMSDNTLPTLTVIGPLVATNDTTPRVVAETRDSLAGFATAPATLLIDGIPVPEGVTLDPTPDGLRITYDVPSALLPGQHTFELRVADKAGNVVTESWKVSIDGDAPAITVNPTAYSPGTEAAKVGGTVTLNLTVKDASGVSQVLADTSAISGSQPSTRLTRLVGTDVFTGTLPVTAGDASSVKRIPITATDLAGNTRVLDVEIPVDNVPPQVGEANAADIGFTKAVLVARGNEPIILAATATAPNSPPVTAAMRNASVEARLTLDGLLPSRTYQYQVQALDRAGNAVTLAGGFATRVDSDPPTAVGPLSVIDLLNGTLRLSWAPATDNVAVAFYRVYRSEDGATFAPHAEVRAPTFDDANLPYEKQFVYQVVAVDHGANEGPTNERLRASATAVPRLTAGLVTPTVGSTSTTFRYTATYVSQGGVAPAYMRIVLDGVAQNMTLVSGTFGEGAVYAYETRLAPHTRDAPHTYSFEASDGRYAVQFPEDGSSLRGPLVSGDTLASGAVEGFAAFAQRVPVAGVAGTSLAILVAAAIVGLVVRRKKEGSQ